MKIASRLARCPIEKNNKIRSTRIRNYLRALNERVSLPIDVQDRSRDFPREVAVGKGPTEHPSSEHEVRQIRRGDLRASHIHTKLRFFFSLIEVRN